MDDYTFKKLLGIMITWNVLKVVLQTLGYSLIFLADSGHCITVIACGILKYARISSRSVQFSSIMFAYE
jgi:hypothetical protein